MSDLYFDRIFFLKYTYLRKKLYKISTGKPVDQHLASKGGGGAGAKSAEGSLPISHMSTISVSAIALKYRQTLSSHVGLNF